MKLKLRHKIFKWILEDYAKVEAIRVNTDMDTIVTKFFQDIKELEKKKEIYEKFYAGEIKSLFFPFQRGIKFTIRDVLTALIEYLNLELCAHREPKTGETHLHFTEKIIYEQENKSL